MSNHLSLVDHVYHRLRSEILTGRIASGTKLVELDTANRMKTSQGTVREALQRLEREGLVRREARRATYVTEIAEDEVHEYSRQRSLLESLIIRHAARRIQDVECEQLEALIEKMATAGRQGDIEALIESDTQFHELICECANSPVLFAGWLPLFLQIQRYVGRHHERLTIPLPDIAETHRPIMRTLCARDADAAAAAIEEHIVTFWKHMESASSGGKPPEPGDF